MTAQSAFDRSMEDVSNIIQLEHVNLAIADQRLATIFYGLGRPIFNEKLSRSLRPTRYDKRESGSRRWRSARVIVPYLEPNPPPMQKPWPMAGSVLGVLESALEDR